MKFSIKTFMLVGVAALSALVLAADGTLLKLTPKEGTAHKYKLTAVFDAGGAQANVTGEVTEKVVKVDSTSGDVTIERIQGALSIDVGGQTIPVDASAPSVHVYHSDGSLVEIRGEGLTPSVYRLTNLNTVSFPKDPVSADTTWKVEIPADAKTGAVKATATYKVLGFEKLMGVDTVKVSSTVKESEGDVPAASDGIVWINVADGTVVKYDGNWTNAPVPPAPMPISGKYTLTLIP